MKPQTPPVPPLDFARYLVGVKKRLTRRGKFLGEMERVLPWGKLLALLSPQYPASGKVGRPPIGLERMLRMYLLQQWFYLSDEAVEDALHDSRSMGAFAGIDLSCQSVPDSTTLLNFRHWLERHGLTRQLLECINAHLREWGLLLHEGTLIDATLVAAPSSTKNRAHARDGEMHQTKKGNQWYFGLKVHTGVDAASGLVHSVHVTSANESDVAHAHALLHGAEVDVFADAGYGGVAMREEIVQAQAQGRVRKDIRWHLAQRRSKLKKMAEGKVKELTKACEKVKAQIRARVEHPYHVVKNLFGYRKTRYKGLAKNTAQLYSLFALANLVLAKNRLLALPVGGQSAC